MKPVLLLLLYFTYKETKANEDKVSSWDQSIKKRKKAQFWFWIVRLQLQTLNQIWSPVLKCVWLFIAVALSKQY